MNSNLSFLFTEMSVLSVLIYFVYFYQYYINQLSKNYWAWKQNSKHKFIEVLVSCTSKIIIQGWHQSKIVKEL